MACKAAVYFPSAVLALATLFVSPIKLMGCKLAVSHKATLTVHVLVVDILAVAGLGGRLQAVFADATVTVGIFTQAVCAVSILAEAVCLKAC